MLPPAHAPGAEAEVDFGELEAVIAGIAAKLWMFVMRLSCSGRAFNVAFATRATTKCARRSVPAVDGVMRTSEARSGHCRLGFGGLASWTEQLAAIQKRSWPGVPATPRYARALWLAERVASNAGGNCASRTVRR
jgi:hypothetical protein